MDGLCHLILGAHFVELVEGWRGGPGQACEGVGAKDPHYSKEEWRKSFGPGFSASGQWPVEFQLLLHLGGSSLALGKVDQQDGGANNQWEVGHAGAQSTQLYN